MRRHVPKEGAIFKEKQQARKREKGGKKKILR